MKIKLIEQEVRTGRNAHSIVNPIDVRWEISTEERERFIATLPLMMGSIAENADPHAAQRRPAEFQVGDADGASSDED